jgi:hypothetical protein
VALWYLRLNGYLAIPNFILHPDKGGSQRTEVDLIGVRFRHRSEPVGGFGLPDDPAFVSVDNHLVLVESKTGTCAINEPWFSPDNSAGILRSVGVFNETDVPQLAAELSETGAARQGDWAINYSCFGETANPNIRLSCAKQVTWSQALNFIHSRFRAFPVQKSAHEQWGKQGVELWSLASQGDAEVFEREVRRRIA